ncbi:hypothetical protein TARUN_5896 [Trichoderma arundinaceum]|uniref:Uncharacterized protein n=1 Tax=Trichoderma arundinaceum TaxID=490622 RepID=A0A395NKE2_TRIAR|nr:hypothetical protein TARUN_5896 [Trichoderma arundinaceum]
MLPLALLVAFAAQAKALCYYPDGSAASGDVPCTDSTQNSACCGTGYACLSNGICQATGDELQKPGATEFVRGSCTDKSWRSSGCQTFCVNPDEDFLAGGEGMAKCSNTSQDIYWCINSPNVELQKTQDPCDDQNAIVFFPGTPHAITTIGVTPSTTSQAPTSTSSSTTLATTTTSSSTTSTGTSTTTSSSSAATETAPPSSSKSSNGGVIGGAVGGSLGGVAIVAVLAFLFLRRRRRSSSSMNAGIHEMDYTPVAPKGSSSPLVPQHSMYPAEPVHNIGVLHEAPGSTQFELAKKHTPDNPMELPA